MDAKIRKQQLDILNKIYDFSYKYLIPFFGYYFFYQHLAVEFKKNGVTNYCERKKLITRDINIIYLISILTIMLVPLILALVIYLISIENNMELISINNQFLKYVFLPLVILY
jgi:cytochrome c biogenesis factor